MKCMNFFAISFSNGLVKPLPRLKLVDILLRSKTSSNVKENRFVKVQFHFFGDLHLKPTRLIFFFVTFYLKGVEPISTSSFEANC